MADGRMIANKSNIDATFFSFLFLLLPHAQASLKDCNLTPAKNSKNYRKMKISKNCWKSI